MKYEDYRKINYKAKNQILYFVKVVTTYSLSAIYFTVDARREGKEMSRYFWCFFLSAPSFRVDTNISYIKRKILTILKYIIDHKIDHKRYKNKIMNILLYLRSILDNIYNKIQVIQKFDKKMKLPKYL